MATPTIKLPTPEEQQAMAANAGKPGYDVFGNAVGGGQTQPVAPGLVNPNPAMPGAPVPTDPIASSGVRRYTAPTSGTYDTEAGAYFAGTPKTAPDEATIRQQMRDNVQGQIDAITNSYAGLIAKENVAGAGRLGQTRAVAARSGTLGSDFGNASLDKTAQLNADQVAALTAQRDTVIQGILGKIDDQAYQRSLEAKATASKNSTDYLGYLKSVQDTSRADVATLAKSGAALTSLTDAQYKRLLDSSGYTPEQLNTAFVLNKPPETVLTSFTQGNKYYVVTQDPVTKARKTETVDLGFTVPQDYNQTKLDDSTIVFYPNKFDPTKPIKDQIMTYTVGNGSSVAAQKAAADLANVQLRNKQIEKDLAGTADESVTKDLQDAATAIAGGADADKVRQRFLDSHPKSGDLYLKYTKQAY